MRPYLIVALILSSFASFGATAAPTAKELVDRLQAAQEPLNHSIVKFEAHTRWDNDYSKSTRSGPMDGPSRDYSGKMEYHKVQEVRVDGQRCAVRESTWSDAGIPVEQRADYKPERESRSWLWDGQRYYFYSYRTSSPIGGATIYEGERWSGVSRIAMGGAERELRGYLTAADGKGYSLLSSARSLKVRDGMARAGKWDCFVLEADTDHGQIVVWIDPAHGYNAARVEVVKRKGDRSGSATDAPLPEGMTVRTVLDSVQFERVQGVWVTMVACLCSETESVDGASKSVTLHRRAKVELNPDFDALKAFVPDDIKEGAPVCIWQANASDRTSMVPTHVWRDGKLVARTGGG